MNTILLVEDAPEYQVIISKTLSAHKVHVVTTATEAVHFVQTKPIDLILLDINLPDRDGYSVLSTLQSDSRTVKIPVMCLTGNKELHDKVTAFSLGADDYIVKPFDPLELRARVEGKLAKMARSKDLSSFHRIGDLKIDQSFRRVSIVEDGSERELDLTQKEFKLLSCFVLHPEQILSRQDLLRSVWGENTNVLERAVDVHLCSLRKKMGPQGQYIRALQGAGYKFVPQLQPAKSKAG